MSLPGKCTCRRRPVCAAACFTDLLRSVDTVPRVFESTASLPPNSCRDGEGKGKGRAQDYEVKDPLMFGEVGWVPLLPP